MRLLCRDSHGNLTLTDDLHDHVPAYAILSHTWGKEEEEVTFQDIWTAMDRRRAGKENRRGERKTRRKDMRSPRFAENKLLGMACSTSGLTLVFLFLRMSHFGSKPSSSTFR